MQSKNPNQEGWDKFLSYAASFYLLIVKINILCVSPPTPPGPFLHLFLLGFILFTKYFFSSMSKANIEGLFQSLRRDRLPWQL